VKKKEKRKKKKEKRKREAGRMLRTRDLQKIVTPRNHWAIETSQEVGNIYF
jgi:hypothetical protein